MIKKKAMPVLRSALSKLPRTMAGDKIFLWIMFLYAHKRIPKKTSNLFNDYLYFLKSSSEIFDILRQYSSDKVLVKSFVAERCAQDIVLPTLHVFHSIDEIDASVLNVPCVLKPAHSSGTVIFVDTDQQRWREGERAKLQAALESSPYTSAREANYKYLRRRIICEPMLPSAASTKDYKIFCYLGEPKVIQVDSDRHSAHKRNLYTASWDHIKISYNFPIGKWEPPPNRLSDMLKLSRKLSVEFDFVRVDFFIDGNALYVAELTHCPESAHGRFESLEAERHFSALIFSQAG